MFFLQEMHKKEFVTALKGCFYFSFLALHFNQKEKKHTNTHFSVITKAALREHDSGRLWMNGLLLELVVPQPRRHDEGLGVGAVEEEVMEEVMDWVQMVSGAGRTAGAPVALFSTAAHTHTHTATTVTMLTPPPTAPLRLLLIVFSHTCSPDDVITI